MAITGRTRLFLTIGDPIAQVRAPEVFNPLFAERGIDAVMVPLQVPAGGLDAVWPTFRACPNLGGMAVTVPHKPDCARLCDALTEEARLTRSVNAIRREADGRLVGGSFDGAGFVAGLRAMGHEPAGRRVFLAGAGGAAAAVALALARAGVASLTIANRTADRAVALAATIAAACPDVTARAGPPDPRDADIAVNCTALGMAPSDPLPFAVDDLPRTVLVAEIVMKPETTPLLAAAQARGNPIHHGRHMLDHQIDLIGRFIGCLPEPGEG